MNVRILFTLISLAMATIAGAQDNVSGQNVVLFDPLFWKDELKLDDNQCQKIRQINSDYYRKLMNVVQESGSNAVVRARANQSLIERSEEIWDTFHPKQRKKWRKISHDTIADAI